MKSLFTIFLFLFFGALYFLLNFSLDNEFVAPNGLSINIGGEVSKVKTLEGINKYNSIIDRPLFVEDRKFEEEEVVVVKKAKPVLEDLKVQALGIALSGEGLLAVIKDLKNGQTLRLHIGDDIYGWVLKGVSESSFTFSKDKREKVVKFKE